MVLRLLRTEANTAQEERSADQCEVERLGQLGLASNGPSPDLGLFQAFVEWGPSARRHSRGWIIPGEDRGKIEGRLDLRDGGSGPMAKVSPRGRHEDEVTTTSSQVTPGSDNRRNKVAVVKAWTLTGAEGGGGTCLSVDDLLHIRKSGGLGQGLIQDKQRLEAEWGVKVQRGCDLNPVVPDTASWFSLLHLTPPLFQVDTTSWFPFFTFKNIPLCLSAVIRWFSLPYIWQHWSDLQGTSSLAVHPTRSFLCGSGSRIVIMNSLPSKQVQVHINGECMISCRATHILGALQFRRKKMCRKKQYQAMGKWPKSRASLSENVISRPSRDRPNKDELAHLEEALASAKYCTGGSTLKGRNNCIQETIERTIFNCRFLTLMAVAGSLAGSVLCFIKGCFLVLQSFSEYFCAFWQRLDFGQIIVLLVEAIDVYLMGTVMLIFGMGLYELFISSLQEPSYQSSQGLQREPVYGSNLFGLFHLRERPLWLEIHSLEELKTKIGHVIVMILLVSLFEKSKRVAINTGLDMICFSVSILLSSASIFLLSRLSVK